MSVPERVTPAETPGAEPHAAPLKGIVRKGIVGLVVVLIVVCGLAASLIGSAHLFKPHNLAFGVVGSSPLVSAVGKELSLKTIQYPNESAVDQAIDQTNLYGALIAGSSSDTLILVPSASFIIQLELGPAFRAEAAKQHWTPTGFVDTIRSGTMVYEERTGSGTGSQEVHPGI